MSRKSKTRRYYHEIALHISFNNDSDIDVSVTTRISPNYNTLSD